MGTHPIFESDFDCLTDSTGLIKIKMARNSSTAGGIMKHSRSKMYSRRAQHKRTKTVTKAEKKAAGAVSEKQIGGAKNGGSRKVVAVRQPKYYPTLSIRRKVQVQGQWCSNEKMHRLCMHCYFNQARHLWCFCSRTCQRCLLQESRRSKED